jgi:hypothetical protein
MTPEYLTAWQEGFEQRGHLLVSIFCRLHGESVGEIRASPAGPIFITRQALSPKPEWIRDKIAVRAKGRHEPTVKPIIAWGGYLFDHPERPTKAPAHCPGCGSGVIDPMELRNAVEDALRSGPQKHIVERVVLPV